ncbi:SAG family member (sag13) [Eimeria tenella]|uniref:SAG family member (Sag13) n=1 Tax=Eimeria tenella TaxID=5802 RepID=Q70CD1_EIMTE|nr:SAG family member (sag13) [Eimeria tenella]CAE52304.1 surface antigen 13 [Eimeria tenella]CDJ37177.1 SAG family member (sag13) [Eimeria tenella]|eukprot:XP_013228015.1 SAG family member (sag13) [Eimeria tenella]
MSRLGLLACYAGLFAGAAAPDFSTAVPIRSAAVNPHHKILDTEGSSLAQVATAPSASKKTTECLPILNALRTEGLNGLLKGLVEAGDGEASQIQPLARSGKTTIQIASELAGTNKESCDATNANQSQYAGLVITFDVSKTFDCEALINASFTAGLDHLQKADYNATADESILGTPPLDNIAAKNLAAIVSTKAEKVECAATTDCVAGKNVLFCYFIQPLEKEQAQPIDANVYEALLKRQRGSASIAVPGITAMLFSLALILLS